MSKLLAESRKADRRLVLAVLFLVFAVAWVAYWSVRCREELWWLDKWEPYMLVQGILPPVYLYCSDG